MTDREFAIALGAIKFIFLTRFLQQLDVLHWYEDRSILTISHRGFFNKIMQELSDSDMERVVVCKGINRLSVKLNLSKE